ncbi:MAG: AAA family ATPase [Sphaerochaetaceae bacterium]|nr:AAA family ATPase [Sphaerochaetaceae bacterium]
MILKNVEISKYKSYSENQTIEINEKVTTLVGKNESGKTAFLEALAKSNYFEEDEKFKLNATIDYPRKELAKYKKDKTKQFATICTYIIGDEILTDIKNDLGNEVFEKEEFSFQHNYDGTNTIGGVTANVEKYLSNLFDGYDLSPEERKELDKSKTIKDFLELKYEPCEENKLWKYKEIQEHIKSNIVKNSIDSWDDPLSSHIYKKYLSINRPKFWYYDEYYELPSRININNLSRDTHDSELNENTMKTAKALFDLAGIEYDDILSADSFESFLADLEATSNSITDDIFEYWTTNNEDLEIKFEIETISNSQKILDIRVRNNKHRVTLPLRNRSKGFNWFFSFIVWFSKIQSDSNNYILLLDEPGLNLHASAQNDLLRFIDDLSEKYQIVYTTHSPFMISSNKIDRVRTVFDSKEGTKISETIQEKDPDTLFPLQAALGYDIAQNLFISKFNLLVEGPADLLYLSTISSILESTGRESLREDITIVPVGGLDKVTSFISLLRGSKLDIVCLLDSFNNSKGKQKLDNMVKQKIIKDKNIIFFDEFTTYSKSDIEDLFEKSEYLILFNETYSEFDIKEEQIDDNPILNQINRIIKKDRFNHYLPAKTFISRKDLDSLISEKTLVRFENVIKKVNGLFK